MERANNQEGLRQVRSLQEKLVVNQNEHKWHEKQHENLRWSIMEAESKCALLQAQLKRSEHEVAYLEQENTEQRTRLSELQAELQIFHSNEVTKFHATIENEITELKGRVAQLQGKDQHSEKVSHQLNCRTELPTGTPGTELPTLH